MNTDVIDLLELQLLMKEGVEDLFPQRLWVRAEIASVQVKANGHCYIDLCQNQGGRVLAKAKAVIWRSRYLPLAAYFREATGGSLAAGMEILARVQPSYSELYGFSLSIDEIEPQFTLGAAELEKRRTIERLSGDGLMDAQKGLEAAALPYRLAVISAASAAGYGDFCRHLEGNPYGFRFSVTLFEATMQGENAPQSITDALQDVQCAANPFDAVLILRGGGSALDLACFDDYGMCLAIATCPVPVFTAIGHERDNHVADMVAYCAVKTPTALADLFIDAYAAEDERISSFSTRLRTAFLSRLSAMDARLDALGARIRAADPRNVLSRGYALITGADTVVRKSASVFAPGDELRVVFSDGELRASVFEIKTND